MKVMYTQACTVAFRSVVTLCLIMLASVVAWGGNSPRCNLNSCKGEAHNIYVRGWAFDPDAPDWQLTLQVYVYTDPYGQDLYTSKKLYTEYDRSDIVNQYNLPSDSKPGFEGLIPIKDPGTYYVQVYALDMDEYGDPGSDPSPMLNSPYSKVTVKNFTTISSAADWNTFVTIIKTGGEDFSGKTVTLTADIPTAEEIAAGTTAVTTMTSENKAFCGTFDGAGHTINVDISDSGVGATGLFSNVKGATIKDLTVTGSINNNCTYAGGLVGTANGATIQNCTLAATITSSGDEVGAFVGGYRQTDGPLTLENCVFSGAIHIRDYSSRSGKAAGLVSVWGNASLNISNCLVKGTFTSERSGSQFYPIAFKSADAVVTANVDGAYYLSTLPATVTGSEAVPCAEGLAVSATATGKYDRAVVAADASTYYAVSPSYFFVENGISSAEDWVDFAALVNGGVGSFEGKTVKLYADINVSTMVGLNGHPFCGTFDGQGNTLNVNISGTGATAPFASINGATIKDLTVTGSVSGGNHSSGLVAACGADYPNVISGCTVNANVSGAAYLGGIVGHGGSGTLTIKDCVYGGTVSGFSSYAGGLLGWCDALTLTIDNCLMKGSMTPASGGKYHPTACKNGGSTVVATIAKTYYLNTAMPTASGNVLIPDDPSRAVSATCIAGQWSIEVTAVDGKTYYKQLMIDLYNEPTYFYGFESSLEDAGWTVIDGSSGSIIRNTPINYEGSQIFTFNLYKWDKSQYLISPQIACSAAVKAEFHTYGYEPTLLQVGYSTTTNELNAFTWNPQTYLSEDSWLTNEITFPKGTKYIAFRVNPNHFVWVYIDAITITASHSPAPANLVVNAVTDETATLSWQAPDADKAITGYAYQYCKQGENWSTVIPVNGTSVTLNNLASNTDYNFRVKALYADGESSFLPTTFTTPLSFPYDIGFENGLDRWKMVNCYDKSGISTEASYNGEKCFFFYGTFNPQYLISPRLLDSEPIAVSFKYKDRRPDSGYDEIFYVGYSTTTDDINAFTWDGGTKYTRQPWTIYDNHFPAGTKYIAIKWGQSDYTPGTYIDNISIMEYSAYAKPVMTAYQNISETEVAYEWAKLDGATGYVYQYKKDNEDTWSPEVTVTTNNIHLTNLTPNTRYIFRVKALYGSYASNYISFSFQTDGLMVSLPYSDGFEDGMGCWRLANPDPYTRILTTDNAQEGNHCLYIHEGENDQSLESPHVPSGTYKKMTFYYKAVSSSFPAYFRVGYSNTNKGSFQMSWFSLVTADSGTWKRCNILNIPPEAEYIWICVSKEGSALYLDNFNIEAVGDITLTDNADNTATINNNDGELVNVTLQGRTLYKDGDWNTICLPFDKDNFVATPFVDAIVKELDEETSRLDNEGTLTLNFKDATSIKAGKPYLVRWQLADVLIKTAADWDAFAASVANGNTYEGKTIRLMNNISVSTMVGTEEYPFSGSFDGAGHTLNVTINAGTTTYAAPFRYINGATLKNITVTGNIVGGKHCAGLVGRIEGSGIDNYILLCDVRATINCRSTHCGGILGHAAHSKTDLAASRFGGSILGENLTNVGILWGWSDGDATGAVLYCLATGTYTDCDGVDLGRGADNVTVWGAGNYTTQDIGHMGDYTTATGNALVELLGQYWTMRGGVVVPVIETTSDVTTNPKFSAVTIDADASTSVAFAGGSFVGIYEPVNIYSAWDDNFYLGANNALKTPKSENYTLNAFRAYFHIGSSANVKSFVLNFDGDTENTTSISPRQLLPVADEVGRGDAWTDLNGRRLAGKPTRKGLYIHQGKKLVIQ